MRAKKSLGQNFLKSGAIVADILNTAGVKATDTVLEIGPGKGVLTEGLLRKAKTVIAVEKDGTLIEYLKEKFSTEIKSGKLKLIHGDILDLDIISLHNALCKARPCTDCTGGCVEYKLVANIPYYITGQIFRLFLESKSDMRPSRMVLMVQKEVAERIVAKPTRAGGSKKESIFSISVKVYGTPRLVKKVPARYFSPQPKVDSAILLIEGITSPFKNAREEKHFFEILKKGFAHKRKLLKSNLGCSGEILSKCDLNETARAEELDVKDWMCLGKKVQ